jgi:hypothetical protein
MSKFSIPYLYNPGVLVGQISPVLNSKIKKIVTSTDAKVRPYNHRLVSSIKETYQTPHIPELWKYVDDMFYVWKREFCLDPGTHKIVDVWTNYMKKGEFNPLHDHNGALASFVLWVQIPFKSENEKQFPKYAHPISHCASGTFQFLYSTITGEILNHIIHNDTSDEGTLLMFPAKLKHVVYPFYTSDEERISIAGNITV